VQVLGRKRPACQQGDTDDRDQREPDRPHATILQDGSAETSSQGDARLGRGRLLSGSHPGGIASR